MMGVDSVESSSKQKAMKNRIDKGVAGRSMMAKGVRVCCEDPARQRPALETLRGVERRSRPGGAALGKCASGRRGRSRKQAYARSLGGETSDDWGCTGDACWGIGPARKAHRGCDELTRGEGAQVCGGRRSCCGEKRRGMRSW